MYPIIVYTEIAAFFTDVYRTFQATVQRSIENETVIFRSTGNTDFSKFFVPDFASCRRYLFQIKVFDLSS